MVLKWVNYCMYKGKCELLVSTTPTRRVLLHSCCIFIFHKDILLARVPSNSWANCYFLFRHRFYLEFLVWAASTSHVLLHFYLILSEWEFLVLTAPRNRLPLSMCQMPAYFFCPLVVLRLRWTILQSIYQRTIVDGSFKIGHTRLANMRVDEILDLTAAVFFFHFYFLRICFSSS